MWYRETNETSEADQSQRRQDMATLFRQRRHISQEDTLSLGGLDLTNESRASVEHPTRVSDNIRAYYCSTQFNWWP